MHKDIDELIKQNRGLIFKQIHKLHLGGDPEAESIGYEALYNAILNYEPSRGAKLSTIASVYIYNALGCYIRHLNCKRQLTLVSYNTPINKDDKKEIEILDVLPLSYSLEDEYIHKEVCNTAMNVFNKSYDKLTNECSKQILHLWRESDFTAKTTDIAKQVGVSQSYASRVINNFKASLKKQLEGIYYD